MAKSSAIHQLPRGCAWPCLVIGIFLALLGLGSLLGLPKSWVRSRQLWTEVPGSVAESYLKEGTRRFRDRREGGSRPSERTWDVRLKYRYRVNGRDFTGDAKAVGKPIASDLREGKVTLPLIHLLRQPNDGEGSRIVRDIIASRSVTPEQWAVLLRTLKEHASIDYAYRRAVEYTERAKKPLCAFPPSSERDALLALPDYVLSRDR